MLAALSTPDTVVLCVVAFFLLRGAVKGFVWQALRTAGLLAGLFLGARHNVTVGGFLAERFSFVPTSAASLVGWAVVVIGVFVAVTMVAHLARSAVREAKLTGLDRSMGAVLGAVLGLGAATLGFTLWMEATRMTDDERRDLLGGAVSTTWMAKLVDAVEPMFPQDIRDRWSPVLRKLER